MLNQVYIQLAVISAIFTLLGITTVVFKFSNRMMFLLGFLVMLPSSVVISMHGDGALWRRCLIIVFVAIYVARMSYVLFYWFKNTGAAKLEVHNFIARISMPLILTNTCCWLYCAPFFWAANRKGSFESCDIFAIMLYCIGTSFHFGADLQKRKFRQNPANKGTLLKTGFWGMSRHPNYFGDFLIYLSFAVFSDSLFGLVAPIVNVLQYAFDAIPKNEAMNAERYGEEWQNYVRRVKLFVPYLF